MENIPALLKIGLEELNVFSHGNLACLGILTCEHPLEQFLGRYAFSHIIEIVLPAKFKVKILNAYVSIFKIFM